MRYAIRATITKRRNKGSARKVRLNSAITEATSTITFGGFNSFNMGFIFLRKVSIPLLYRKNGI